MKKTLLTVACALLTLGLSAQQWNQLGDYKIKGKVGIGTSTPSQKLSIVGGNLSIWNWENATIYSGAHNLYFSGFDKGYAHKVYTFRPAWGTIGSTFSCLQLQTADTKGEYTTRIKLHSSGISYFNGGNVGIGTTDPGSYKLAVKGKVGCGELVVTDVSKWADFVFDSNYDLMSLSELDAFIKENKHLPEIPTTKEVSENGVSVGEMNAKLLQKIEELTLYVIELKNENIKQNKIIEELLNKH